MLLRTIPVRNYKKKYGKIIEKFVILGQFNKKSAVGKNVGLAKFASLHENLLFNQKSRPKKKM